MCYINDSALHLSEQILIVVFILGISMANISLIILTVRRNGFMIIISLAIGDTLLALFSLAVDAKQIYGSIDIGCRTAVTASIYGNYVIHFVYGVGIMFLALEFVIRHKVRRPLLVSNTILEAFIYSAAPWLLMLIIVLPLTMAGADWVTCHIPVDSISGRNRAAKSVSVLLPAIAALITSVVLMCLNFTPVQAVYLNPRAPQQELNNLLIVQRNVPWNDVHVVQPQSGFQHNSADNKLGDPQHPQEMSQPINNIQQVPYQPSPSYESLTRQHQSLQRPYPQPAYTEGQPTSEYYQPTQQHGPNPDHSAHVTSNSTEEKRIILWLALVHFICVIPQAVLSIAEFPSLSQCPLWVLAEVFYWLSKLRSFITPIIIMAKFKSSSVRSDSSAASSSSLESCSHCLAKCLEVSSLECCDCIDSCCDGFLET